MWQRFSTAGLALVTTLAGVVVAGTPATAGPVLYTDSPDAVPGRYIVTLADRSGVGDQARGLTRRFGGQVRHVFDQVGFGFSAAMSESQARRLADDPAVASVEQVQRITVQDTQTNPPNWGDDRIDQRSLPLDRSFTYPAGPGQGVTVYVLDTGINAAHAEFSGRVRQGVDIVDGDSNPADCHGHGTHVAGTAAGTTYGIAKKASVVAVRVLNCQGSGTNDDLIAGINWVRSNAQRPAVANYSIGCGSRCTSQAMDSAVTNLIGSGVQFVQAAGNSSDNACYYSPQAVPAAITVGNSNSSDARYTTSNYGSCLDLFAPGTSIVSASYSSNTGSATMTGTSMASPHVAGAAAAYLGINPSASPAQVRDALVTNGTTGKITGGGSGSPNVLLYTGFLSGGPGPDPDPDPTCTPNQPIGNPGFESGSSPWTSTANVIGTWSQYPARTGTRNAWLNGGGQAQTDTLSQRVTLPSCETVTLRFWIRIATAEYDGQVYDRLTLTAGGATVAAYTNLDKTSGYVEKAVDLSAFAGQTVDLVFTGVEDWSLQTSFVIDDVSVSASS
ncbi:S8 family serine peptidase [Actinoplanes sp. NPDC051861]|uniref:S8 family serine peptidase n=1 Tax=Actinoplanes sp. NPDC051861 TaxID=3155170 RepID=UPI0034196B54